MGYTIDRLLDVLAICERQIRENRFRRNETYYFYKDQKAFYEKELAKLQAEQIPEYE